MKKMQITGEALPNFFFSVGLIIIIIIIIIDFILRG